jgi:biotin-(acetyl-CoA carboxylase) ligase
VGDRKIGGILIESATRPASPGAAIIGFGVNHGHQLDQLPSGAATSLRLESTTLPTLARLSLDLVVAVTAELAHARDVRYAIARYGELSLHQPGDQLRCRIAGREIAGRFIGFDPLGHLRLEHDGVETLVAAGELVETREAT